MTNHNIRENLRTNTLEHVKTHFNPDLYGRNFFNMLVSLGIKYNE